MFTFPFASMMGGTDPFDPYDYPLINHYDPSCPYAQVQELLPKEEAPQEEIPKLEAPTSPGYVYPPPPDAMPSLELPQKEGGKAEKGKKMVKPQRDDDYRPYPRANRGAKGSAKQKQDRNLIPNTVHHLIAFVQKHFKSSYLTEHLFARLSPSPLFTLPRYYNFHRMLRAEINHYVNEEAIRIVTEPGILSTEQYAQEEQEFYCRVSRIVARKFLKVEAVLMILRSKKVRRQNILEHLSVQRYLYENMTALKRL